MNEIKNQDMEPAPGLPSAGPQRRDAAPSGISLVFQDARGGKIAFLGRMKKCKKV
jgi:hypothetical protein